MSIAAYLLDYEDELDELTVTRRNDEDQSVSAAQNLRHSLLGTPAAPGLMTGDASALPDIYSRAYDWTGLCDEENAQLPEGFIPDFSDSQDDLSKIMAVERQAIQSLNETLCHDSVDNEEFLIRIQLRSEVENWSTDYAPEDCVEYIESPDAELEQEEASYHEEEAFYYEYDGLSDAELTYPAELGSENEHRVTREVRAGQQALAFAQQYQLDDHMQDHVFDAFCEWGWNATKRALAREVSKGLTVHELELGIALRRLWASDESLWAVASCLPEQTALSWIVAVAIGKAFNAYPDIEEVEHWIQDARDRWGASPALRREHSTFHAYVLQATRSAYNSQLVSPGVSLVESGFHDQYDDDFSCGSSAGAPPESMPYERAFSGGGFRS